MLPSVVSSGYINGIDGTTKGGSIQSKVNLIAPNLYNPIESNNKLLTGNDHSFYSRKGKSVVSGTNK